MKDPRPEECLAPTTIVDSAHPAIVEFARQHGRGATDRERTVALYYAVRDGFRYDPYRVDLSPDGMRASSVLSLGYGWCVTKAALLGASCRALGIPARLGFADVRNHLSTERMRQTMKTDLFTWHGYTDVWLGGAWRKATPAFNVELCDKFGLLPLDFDGENDSIYHPFDRSGNRHMEYVHQRGAWDDVPLDEMHASFAELYPGWAIDSTKSQKSVLAQADFLADVDREA
jgi:transglutaminase-like putative cysteine protease